MSKFSKDEFNHQFWYLTRQILRVKFLRLMSYVVVSVRHSDYYNQVSVQYGCNFVDWSVYMAWLRQVNYMWSYLCDIIYVCRWKMEVFVIGYNEEHKRMEDPRIILWSTFLIGKLGYHYIGVVETMDSVHHSKVP